MISRDHSAFLIVAAAASIGAGLTAPHFALAAAPAADVPPAAAIQPGDGSVQTAQAPERCMRLPLSDIAFGREGTIAQARMRLDEFAAKEQRRRGWGGGTLSKSNETISCDVFLFLGPLGTEYKCLVTATYCQR